MRRILFMAVMLTAVSGVYGQSASSPDDGFIAGYATAVLERQMQVRNASVSVDDGLVTVHVDHAGAETRGRIERMLGHIEGVQGVKIVTATAQPSAAVALKAEDAPQSVDVPGAEPVTADADRYGKLHGPRGQLLPPGHLFRPLMADPRWPHLSASFLSHENDALVSEVGAANLGGEFAIYRHQLDNGGQVELGLQAGAFAIFDMDSDSKDSLNTDYFVAGTLSYRKDKFSTMLRLSHLSSHVGDELLERDRSLFPVDNISYEAVKLLGSYDLFDDRLRVYGGGAIRTEGGVTDDTTFELHYGVEFRSGRTFLQDYLRPVAAVDVKQLEGLDWDADVSVRAGVAIEDPILSGHELLILAEYYNGHSPNGQFFDDNIEYIGVGAHFFY